MQRQSCACAYALGGLINGLLQVQHMNTALCICDLCHYIFMMCASSMHARPVCRTRQAGLHACSAIRSYSVLHQWTTLWMSPALGILGAHCLGMIAVFASTLAIHLVRGESAACSSCQGRIPYV